jgi:thioredoxin 1
MTNVTDLFPPTCSSQGRGSNDLIPLLVVVAVLVAAHFIGRGLNKSKGTSTVKNMKNVVIVAVLVIAVAAVIVAKQGRGKPAASVQNAEESAVVQRTSAESALPRLVDLGATKCIPCKMMAPILEELKQAYVGKLRVDFIDVWENPGAGKGYGIRVIPTQIFYDAQGKERFRHEGFFAKKDILAKWTELGVPLAEAGGATQ